MIETDELEVWNLTDGGTVTTRAQRIFNVVGRVRCPESVSRLTYCLNGNNVKDVVVRTTEHYQGGRLWRNGDFNIDTISRSELREQNTLDLTLIRSDGLSSSTAVRFGVRDHQGADDVSFELDLSKSDAPEQVAQVVDGPWKIGGSGSNRFLEISAADAGYDRIALFGSDKWTTGYVVHALLEPISWTSPYHNLGLVFKWNPHEMGDGIRLPTTWTTGLGYYCSYTPGLRLRFGEKVHVDAQGRKVGDFVLAEEPYSRARRLAYLVAVRARLGRIVAQLPTGSRYHFRLLVSSLRYSLAVWPEGADEPSPQLVVQEPAEIITHGSVGVIALCCGVRVHRFQVEHI